jgi:hypothetical protein
MPHPTAFQSRSACSQRRTVKTAGPSCSNGSTVIHGIAYSVYQQLDYGLI